MRVPKKSTEHSDPLKSKKGTERLRFSAKHSRRVRPLLHRIFGERGWGARAVRPLVRAHTCARAPAHHHHHHTTHPLPAARASRSSVEEPAGRVSSMCEEQGGVHTQTHTSLARTAGDGLVPPARLPARRCRRRRPPTRRTRSVALISQPASFFPDVSTLLLVPCLMASSLVPLMQRRPRSLLRLSVGRSHTPLCRSARGRGGGRATAATAVSLLYTLLQALGGRTPMDLDGVSQKMRRVSRPCARVCACAYRRRSRREVLATLARPSTDHLRHAASQSDFRA